MIDMSKQAQKAVEDRNSDKIFEVGAYLYDVCSACHQTYPATEAAAAGVKE
jgi:cytochrome c556